MQIRHALTSKGVLFPVNPSLFAPAVLAVVRPVMGKNLLPISLFAPSPPARLFCLRAYCPFNGHVTTFARCPFPLYFPSPAETNPFPFRSSMLDSRRSTGSGLKDLIGQDQFCQLPTPQPFLTFPPFSLSRAHSHEQAERGKEKLGQKNNPLCTILLPFFDPDSQEK